MFILHLLAVRMTGQWWRWTAGKADELSDVPDLPSGLSCSLAEVQTLGICVCVRVCALREKNYSSSVATDQGKIARTLEDVWNGLPIE